MDSNNNDGDDDDITLFTDEEQVAVHEVNHQFSQTSKLKGEVREYTLFNGSQCHQKIYRKHGKKTKHRVNLTCLNPKPKRRLQIADSWLIGCAILGVIDLMLIYVGWFREEKTGSDIYTLPAMILFTASLMCLLIGLFKSDDRMIYYSKFGGIPLLSLINNNPDRKTFEKTTHQISCAIISAQHQANLKRSELLNFELKELQRLRTEGVIDRGALERAKARIFSDRSFAESTSLA